jgi:hypothetical protein
MGPARALLLFVAVVGLPLSAGVVLLASDVLAAWDGRAIARRPADPDAGSVLVVIAQEADGSTFERRWPAEIVGRLELPVVPQGSVPVFPSGGRIPEEAPQTRKSRFGLHYLVEVGEGFEVVPSTTPQAVVLGVVALLVAVGLRNMAVGGAPWSIEPRSAFLPRAQATSGQPAPRAAGPPRKGPPPSRSRVGRGRR